MNAIDLSAMSIVKPATSYTSASLHDAAKLRIGKQGLAAIPPQTIPQHFRECCEQYARLPALVFEADAEVSNGGSCDKKTENSSCPDRWISVSYTEYAQHVQQAALALLHVGLQPRSSVGILAFNCPEWFYVALGALRANGVVAGIYTTNSSEAVYHVLETSEATVCVVDDAIQMAKVRAVRKRLPRLRAVLQLNGPYEDFVGKEEGYYCWKDVVQKKFGDDLHMELERREQDVGANECAMLIYTSGTTGMPKAAMVSHDGILYNAKAVSTAMPYIVKGSEVIVSYLPLSHIAALIFDVLLTMLNGSCVYFADRNALKGSIGKYFARARPTIVFAVPRVFEKIQEKLTAQEQKAFCVSKYIMQKAMETMQEYHLQRITGKTPSSVKYWLASNITRKIQSILGFDRCKAFLVGGAPTSENVKRYFLGLDMPLGELYGMTEASGGTNMPAGCCNLKTVGKALEGVEEKIHSPDNEGHGEICIRSRSCFMGYLNNPEKTKEVLKEDGWLHSGDIGYIDIDGYLYITGRIKEIIITAGGENIPPAHVEDLIKNELPCISNAMVVGDQRKYLTVLLTLKTEVDMNTGLPLDDLQPVVIDWLHSLGLNYTRLSEALNIPADNKTFDASNIVVNPHPKIMESIFEGLKRANEHAIANCQRVQKFALLAHDFSIPTGELGPTLKVRRNIVAQKYANIIEGMY